MEIVVELYLVFILGWWDRFSSYLIIIKSISSNLVAMSLM